MKSLKPFQVVTIAIFVVFIAIGMLAFSGKIPTPGSKDKVNYGEIVVWGTLPQKTFTAINEGPLFSESAVSISYVEKSPSTISQEFIEALAVNAGPDLIIFPHDEVYKNLDKITLMPYQSVPENFFKGTFLEEGELFLSSNGIIALPFVIDPIVMYWNRDIFTNLSLVTPPSRWTEFYTLAPKVTVYDSRNNISQSLVAFGEYSNVTNAKDILSMLIQQSGSKIVEVRGDILTATIAPSSAGRTESSIPAAGAVRFFAEFSKQDKDSYTWNRSLPSSRRMFEAGDLALYFGYASEYVPIMQSNPHLNFAVAVVPQAEQITTKSTFGKMHGVSLVKASKNQAGAMYTALLLTRSDVIQTVSQTLLLPPVRRDLIASRPSSAASSTFYDSAIIARAWRDPSSTETDKLFRTMIESIVSGHTSISDALVTVQGGMSKILQGR